MIPSKALLSWCAMKPPPSPRMTTSEATQGSRSTRQGGEARRQTAVTSAPPAAAEGPWVGQEAQRRSSQSLSASHCFLEPSVGLDPTDKSPDSRTSSHSTADRANQVEVYTSTCWTAGLPRCCPPSLPSAPARPLHVTHSPRTHVGTSYSPCLDQPSASGVLAPFLMDLGSLGVSQ